MYCFKDQSFCNQAYRCSDSDCASYRLLSQQDKDYCEQNNIPVCIIDYCDLFDFNDITVKDYFNVIKKDNFIKSIKKLMPDEDVDKQWEAFELIRQLPITVSADTLLFKSYNDKLNDNKLVNCLSLKKPNDDTNWSTSFLSFDRYLGLQVNNQVCDQCSLDDFIAHMFYDMTFFGYDDKQIKKIKNKVLRAAKKVENKNE